MADLVLSHLYVVLGLPHVLLKGGCEAVHVVKFFVDKISCIFMLANIKISCIKKMLATRV